MKADYTGPLCSRYIGAKTKIGKGRQELLLRHPTIFNHKLIWTKFATVVKHSKTTCKGSSVLVLAGMMWS
jgi:hypothetical protein